MEEHGWHVVLAGDMNVAPKQIDGWPNLRTWPRQHVINRADFNEKFLSRGKYKTNNGKDEVGQEENSDVKRWQGIDVWREMHPEERRYTYHPPNREWGTSCDRVDYVIASKKFYDDGLVTAAGMLDSEVGRGPSDHVPIWVDVRIGLGSSSGENDAGTIDKA
jgi:exonuclease III